MSALQPFSALLSVVDPDYNKSFEVEELTRENRLLKATARLAKRNGLYYWFIQRLIESGVALPAGQDGPWQQEKERLAEFKRTVMLINSLSRDYGIDYILIKGCDTVPNVPRDVDILVRVEDSERIYRALADYGAKCFYSGPVEASFLIAGCIKLDIYCGISYLGMDFVDGTLLWNSRVEKEIFGISYCGLNQEADFLSFLPHTLFGHRSMTLLDFLHLKHLRKEIKDIELCREYAYRQGWGAAFDSSLTLLSSLATRIYEKRKTVSFPYLFKRDFMLKCASALDKVELGTRQKLFFSISLGLDWFSDKLMKSPFYESLASFGVGRKAYNLLNYFVRSMRGDRHGMPGKRGEP